jgi:hypothetical protein
MADYPYMEEGQTHAEALVSAVAREWKADELIKNADPQMLAAFPEPKVEELVAACSRTLGPWKSQRTLMGSTGVAVGVPSGKFASYLIELNGEKATAQVKINLHKVNDKWTVMGLWVDFQGSNNAPRPLETSK